MFCLEACSEGSSVQKIRKNRPGHSLWGSQSQDRCWRRVKTSRIPTLKHTNIHTIESLLREEPLSEVTKSKIKQKQWG